MRAVLRFVLEYLLTNSRSFLKVLLLSSSSDHIEHGRVLVSLVSTVYDVHASDNS